MVCSDTFFFDGMGCIHSHSLDVHLGRQSFLETIEMLQTCLMHAASYKDTAIPLTCLIGTHSMVAFQILP